jgi:hypothetical protein
MSVPGTLNFPTSLDDSTSLFEAANRARSTLNGSITDSATSLVLTSAALFPSSGAIVIDDEIIYYTGKSTNTLTGLIRGRDGSSAAAHSSTTPVKMWIVRAHHVALRDAIIAIQTNIRGTGTNENDAAWSNTGGSSTGIKFADSTSASFNSSANPSLVFQTWRSGGTYGVGQHGYCFSMHKKTGTGDTYGFNILHKYTPDMSGFADETGTDTYNQHGLNVYAIAAPTNVNSGATRNVYIYNWIRSRRDTAGISAQGLQIDVENESSGDADLDASTIDRTICFATNSGGTKQNSVVWLHQAGGKAMAFSLLHRTTANSIFGYGFDMKDALFEIQGTVDTSGTALSGTGTFFTRELKVGVQVRINSVWYTIASITDNDTAALTTSAGSQTGQTLTAAVFPLRLAHQANIVARDSTGAFDYRLVRLASDVWQFDPDARKSVFGGSMFIGAPSTTTLTAAGITDSLHIQAPDATANLLVMDGYGTGAFGALTIRSARGTFASPSAIQSGDIVASYAARPYGLNAFAAGGRAAIQLKASENMDNSAQGMHISVESTPTGSTSRTNKEIIGLDKTLTDAATSLFEVGLTDGAMAGGQIEWTIVASNGTDHQAFTGITTFAMVNKGGVYTKTFTNNASNDAKAVSSGTLTATWSGVDGTNKITVQVTPSGSLTETTYKVYFKVINNSPRVITLL